MEDFTARVLKCAIDKTGTDITPNDLLSLDFNRQKDFIAVYSECYFEELRRVDRSEFEPWLDRKSKEERENLDIAGKQLLSYYSRIGLPYEILAQLTQLGLVFDISKTNRELLWDSDIAPKFLGMALLQLTTLLKSRMELQPYLDLQKFMKNYLGLDINWIISVVVVALEELLVRKKLKEMNIEVGKQENFPRLRKKLVEALNEKGVRPSCEVLKSKGRREIRNRIFHTGDNPTEDEAYRLMGEVIKLSHDLWSKNRNR
jgi:hypothetical protein